MGSGAHAEAAATFVDYWNGDGAWSAFREDVRAAMLRWMPYAALHFHALLSETTPLAAGRLDARFWSCEASTRSRRAAFSPRRSLAPCPTGRSNAFPVQDTWARSHTPTPSTLASRHISRRRQWLKQMLPSRRRLMQLKRTGVTDTNSSKGGLPKKTNALDARLPSTHDQQTSKGTSPMTTMTIASASKTANNGVNVAACSAPARR